ncbi:MAG: site-specific integrase [Rhodobacteraceae bacterium]|nr:site-specific integrase [Paracoccaceae bacterium]
MQITIGRLRGGFCVSWRDPETGKRRRFQLAARSRAAAEAEARGVYLRERASGGGVTIETIWQAYVAHLGTKPTASTMTYTGRAILPFFGAFRPEQVSTDDCRAYVVLRSRQKKAIGTVHTELGHLRSALRWAAKTGLIPRAPHVERPPKPASRVRPMSDPELRPLISACSAPHVQLAVILLVATGARVSAVLDLTWDRVSFETGLIDLRLPDGVTRKGRAVVPMNRMARDALQQAHAARLSDHVVEWAGRRVKSIRTGYQAAMRRAGLSDLSIHQIRHTVAVKMLQAGRPLVEVSQFLGHSNIQITERTYARFMPERFADAARILDLPGFDDPAGTSHGATIRERRVECQGAGWWVMRDLNPRHLRCERSWFRPSC